MKDERLYLRIKYYRNTRRWLHLRHPKEYSEVLQWLKIHDQNPRYRDLVDKYKVKEIVSKTIGEQYVVPLLGVWNSPDEIDFSALPERFVLKCTHLSGRVYCCHDRDSFDIPAVLDSLRQDLATDYYYAGLEWPYKNAERRIIAEAYLENESSEGSRSILTDYKFFCFSGVPKLFYISKDGDKCPTTDFFDADFNPLPIRMRDPNSAVLPSKPECFEQMKALAAKLSEGIPHVRIDFYLADGKIYFGEYTFFHCSGFSLVQPYEWSIKMGAMLDSGSVYSRQR